ncbi:MAG: hypothetical protein ACREAG_02055 [Nitrosopumilaceae archaeon]
MNNKLKLGLGIMVAAAIMGLVYPVLVGLPGADENIIPREASKWKIGKGAQYNPTMLYTITTDKMQFSAKIGFVSDASEKQMIFVEIDDPNMATKLSQNVSLSGAYTFGEVSDDAKPYFKVLDETIFSIRDIALEEKYLVKQAVWDTVFIGATTQEVIITEHGQTSFGFGTTDAFTVSYKIGEKENKFWIVDNLPLPVKAEIYDFDGNLQYSYELTSLLAPSTPGFG